MSLVADTLQFSKNIDTSVVITRADHSTKDVVSFIDELNNSGKLNSLNLVLNGVGKVIDMVIDMDISMDINMI